MLPAFFYLAFFIMSMTTTYNFGIYFLVLSVVGVTTVLISESIEKNYREEEKVNRERVTKNLIGILLKTLILAGALSTYLFVLIDPLTPWIQYTDKYVEISRVYIAISIGFFFMSVILINLLTNKVVKFLHLS